MSNLEAIKKDVYLFEKKKLIKKLSKIYFIITIVGFLILFVSFSSTNSSIIDSELIRKTEQINQENYSLKNFISNELKKMKEKENHIIRQTLNVSSDTNYVDLTDYNIKNLNAYVKNQNDNFSEYSKIIEVMWDSIKSVPNVNPISLADLKDVTDKFGYRKHPILKKWFFHEGVDLSANIKTPIYAPADGIVIKKVKSKRGYGNRIALDHGYGYKTVYAHLYSFNVKSGQKVKKGDIIGFVGNTGLSTGPHLHYEILVNNRSVDPNLFILYDKKSALK